MVSVSNENQNWIKWFLCTLNCIPHLSFSLIYHSSFSRIKFTSIYHLKNFVIVFITLALTCQMSDAQKLWKKRKGAITVSRSCTPWKQMLSRTSFELWRHYFISVIEASTEYAKEKNILHHSIYTSLWPRPQKYPVFEVSQKRGNIFAYVLKYCAKW